MNSIIVHSDIINKNINNKECAVMQGNLRSMFNADILLESWCGGRQGDLNEQGNGWQHGGRQCDLNEQDDGLDALHKKYMCGCIPKGGLTAEEAHSMICWLTEKIRYLNSTNDHLTHEKDEMLQLIAKLVDTLPRHTETRVELEKIYHRYMQRQGSLAMCEMWYMTIRRYVGESESEYRDRCREASKSMRENYCSKCDQWQCLEYGAALYNQNGTL